jgi:polyisoprenoid-binding protein YceI
MVWEIDPVHSKATFSAKYAMISTVRGQFNVLNGQVHIDEQHPENSWVEAQVDAASIDTQSEMRDGHLKSPDFLDVEKYPTLHFKSTRIEHVEDEEYRVTGNLTIHGVTKEVTLDAEYSGQLKDAYSNLRAGLSARGTINRKDWGLNWNMVLEAGGVLVSDKIKIEIDLSVIEKAAVEEPTASQTA